MQINSILRQILDRLLAAGRTEYPDTSRLRSLTVREIFLTERRALLAG